MPISYQDKTDAQLQNAQNVFRVTGGQQYNDINAEITRRKREQERAGYKKQRASELEEFDANSGKFYDLMRQGFRQRTEAQSGAQQTGALGQLAQGAARSGLSFSGVEQAASANLQGQIGQAKVEALSGYDQRLNELRQSARDAFQQGQFDFFHQLQGLAYKTDLDKEFSVFQADLANQYSSGWGDLFGAIGKGIGMFAGGGFSGLFGGGASSNPMQGASPMRPGF